MWRLWGDRFETSEMTNASKFQKVIFKKDTILRAVRTWLIFYNDPVFTSINMKIYSDNSGVPGSLLHTSSNSKRKEEILFDQNAAVETFFEFDEPSFKGNLYYHFVLNASGYTGSDSSHIAWRKAYPDPVNSTGLTISPNKINTLPYMIAFYDSELLL